MNDNDMNKRFTQLFDILNRLEGEVAKAKESHANLYENIENMNIFLEKQRQTWQLDIHNRTEIISSPQMKNTINVNTAFTLPDRNSSEYMNTPQIEGNYNDFDDFDDKPLNVDDIFGSTMKSMGMDQKFNTSMKSSEFDV
eukprot:TRINITY_DN2348_c0_g1_i1.p1 TRINITY_DN2348_c0_g1~~TRINITY_DN2348_c0_g1_i1.p1  ORF type:complete len:149 (-),score=55.12 TRINITY_DN2348_c0_g1_i1:28-447(-)